MSLIRKSYKGIKNIFSNNDQQNIEGQNVTGNQGLQWGGSTNANLSSNQEYNQWLTDTSVQRQAQDLEAAGINKILAAQGQGAQSAQAPVTTKNQWLTSIIGSIVALAMLGKK